MSATIIVEDGSIVSGANSYVSASYLSTFASDRGITISGTKEDLLIKAMDYLEGLEYKGVKRTFDQGLQWPRVDVYIDGWYHNSDEIPQQLKDGLCQCAIAIDQGNGPLADISPQIDRKRVDTLEIQYASNAVNSTVNQKILYTLRKLLNNGTGSNTLVVNKA